MKEVQALTSQVAKLKEQIELKEQEKTTLQKHVQDAKNEKLASKLSLQEQQDRLDSLVQSI
jgi:hypothetical protein